MKNIVLILLLFSQITIAQFGEFKNNRLLTLTIDGSRLIEKSSEFDSGLDIVATLIIDRDAFIQPLVKIEAFPDIHFYKYAVGGNYTFDIYDKYDLLSELSIGFEIGQIIRKKTNLESYYGFYSYGFNAEIRIFKPFENLPIIATYNYQKRTDFEMYNASQKFIGSLYVGLGFVF